MTHGPSDGIDSGALARDRLTRLTYGMAVAFGFSVAVMGPAMPPIRDDLGISRTVGGLHFTALAAGSVAAGFVVQRSVAAWGRKAVFWWGGAGIAIGALLIGAGWTPSVTLAGAVLVGLFGASALIVSQATLSDHHPAHRAVALTEVNIAMSVGSAIPALLIGALVAVGAGWRPALLVPVLVWLALAWLRRGEEFPAPHRAQVADGKHRRLPRRYWLYWLAFAPAVGAEWCIGAWGAGYLVDIAETSEAAASLLMTCFFGAMLAGRFIGGRVARDVVPLVLLLGTTAVGLVGFMIFWVGGSVLPVAVGLLVAGLGISMQFPMLLTLAIEAAPGLVDAATARVSIAAGGAVIVAPLALGFLADQAGIRAAFGIVPILFLLAAGLAVAGGRTR